MLNIFDIVILDTIVNGERRWQQPAYYLPPAPRLPPKPRKPWSWLRLGTWIGVGVAAVALGPYAANKDLGPTVFTAVACGLDCGF